MSNGTEGLHCSMELKVSIVQQASLFSRLATGSHQGIQTTYTHLAEIFDLLWTFYYAFMWKIQRCIFMVSSGLQDWSACWRIGPGSVRLVGGLADLSWVWRIGRRAGGLVLGLEDWPAGWRIGLGRRTHIRTGCFLLIHS